MFSIEQGCLIAPLFCHRPLIVRRSIRIRVRHVFLDRNNSHRVDSSANDHVGFVDPIRSESKIHREGS